MDLLIYLDRKYKKFDLEFYIKAEDWNNIFCYNNQYNLYFTIENPREYPFSLILTKQVHIEMSNYYEDYVENIILQHPLLTRKDKLNKIKSKI